MAISVPIGLPHRNVFLSYNYEFNYYQPEHVYKYPPILVGFLSKFASWVFCLNAVFVNIYRWVRTLRTAISHIRQLDVRPKGDTARIAQIGK